MSRSKAGHAVNQVEFTALFEEHKTLVFRTAYLMLGNRDEAEDALQEVFVLVYRSLSGFDPRKGIFTAWLYRVTINHCLNRHRKRRLSVLPLHDDEMLPQNESPEARLADEEAIRQAIGQLSDRQRAVVVLRYYADLPYAEIARVLDIPLGTVKSRLAQALKSLHGRLAAENDELIPGACLEVEASP